MKKALVLIIVLFFGFTAKGYASYAVIDSHTSRILFASNPHMQLPIASLTKIWTALVVLENAKLDEKVMISARASLSEGSSIYLQEGEIVTVETLLYGLLLRSGNDAAMALAEYVGGSEEGFVYLMNERAVLAGLSRTKFTNASGLHHPQHLSTAYETARMLKIAMDNKEFRKIASSLNYAATIQQTPTIVWENKHKLLATNDFAIAGKTGYTKVAGRTLATQFEIGLKSFVVVTLNEPNDWIFHSQMAELVDRKFEVVDVVQKGSYLSAHYKIRVRQPVKLLLADDERAKLRHTLLVSQNEEVKSGVWQVQLGQSVVHQWRVDLQRR